MPVSGCLWPTILTISLGPPTMASKSPVQRDPPLPPFLPPSLPASSHPSHHHLITSHYFTSFKHPLSFIVFATLDQPTTSYYPTSPIVGYIPAAAGAIHLSPPLITPSPSHCLIRLHSCRSGCHPLAVRGRVRPSPAMACSRLRGEQQLQQLQQQLLQHPHILHTPPYYLTHP